MAKNAQDETSANILLTISKDNVYDGIVGRGYPTDLKRTFIAIRKKNSEEVYKMLKHYDQYRSQCAVTNHHVYY